MKEFACDKCDKKYKNEYWLKEHKRNTHSPEKEEIKSKTPTITEEPKVEEPIATEEVKFNYVEQFVPPQELEKYISRGYTVTELNENSGRDIPAMVRPYYISECKNGRVVYVTKSK